MRITKLTTFVVPPRWLFLKVETDAGVTGWGEPVVEGRAETVAACVAELSDYLIGKDPSAIEDHWTVLYRGGFYRGGAIHMSALAGIDQALWDIKGKVLNQPVHALLGGPVRQKMRVYSWIGGDRPQDIVKGAKEVAAKGFTAIKMLATEELAFLDSHAKLDAVIARVAALREAMGPDFGIAVDFHGRLHRPMAKQLAKELDPYRLMFIEEPVLSEHVEALREIANHTATPNRVSFRYSVEGSMPSVSAARDLFPPSLPRTHMMYARSIASSEGFDASRAAMSGSALCSRMRSGSETGPITPLEARITARSIAFSSSRTLPGQLYDCSSSIASGVRVF